MPLLITSVINSQHEEKTDDSNRLEYRAGAIGDRPSESEAVRVPVQLFSLRFRINSKGRCVPRESTTVTFSHTDPELIERAKVKAKRIHMSFSGYVVSLIERDLGITHEHSPDFQRTKSGAVLEKDTATDRAARDLARKAAKNVEPEKEK